MAEKARKPVLEERQGTKVKISDNKEITLSDGTKIYYSEMDWSHAPSGGTHIITMVVSVYKEGKWVYIEGHFFENSLGEPKSVTTKIVKSLKFK